MVPNALFADLPGYGYAAVARGAKLRWQQVMADYLEVRRSLVGVVLMIDSRLGFTDLDHQLMSFVAPRVGNGSVKLLVLLTKSDKLNRSEATAALASAQAALAEIATDEADVGIALFSALKKVGVGDAAKVLHGWVAGVPRWAAAPARSPRGPAMIDTFDAVLPHGITLSCRAAGGPRARRCWCSCTAFPRPRSSGTNCSSTSATATAASRPTCAASGARRRRPSPRRTASST